MAHVASPAVSDVNTLLAPCVPFVILRLPIISNLAAGLDVPMPTFCPGNAAGINKVQQMAAIRMIYLVIVGGLV